MIRLFLPVIITRYKVVRMLAFWNRVSRQYVVPAVLTLGLLVPLFYHMVSVSTRSSDNIRSFYSFSSGLDGYYELKTAWKTRLFSNVLAWQAARLSTFITDRMEIGNISRPERSAVAFWTAAWFAASALLYVLYFKQRAALYVLGTFAALTFGYMLRLPNTRIYPWDMPTVLIFQLFLILFLENRFGWLLILLPLGMGFKETAGVLCLGFLLSDELPRAARWKTFVVGVVLCALVKLAIDLFTRSNSPLFTMETGPVGGLSVTYLLQNLGTLRLPLFYLINAGTLLAFLLLPAPTRKIRALKLIALAFSLGNFLFGIVEEYRIWLELIPFALYALDYASRQVLPGSSAEELAG